MTYIPIPAGPAGRRGDGFAGLLTVDLPATVRYGNSFDIRVRRVTTRQVAKPTRPENQADIRAAEAVRGTPPSWRCVTGSFLMRIPVQEESTILPGDENLLAILKWRLGLIGPGNRWYPVLLRYIASLSGRIDGMGGNAAGIPPSAGGYQPPSKGGVHRSHECRYTGKVIGVRYDRFGDFEGFTLLSERGHEHVFPSHEDGVEEIVRRALMERFLISVLVEAHDPDWPASIVLHRHK